MDQRPGGTMARRELHFIWLLDTSGSMNVDGKIQALNVAIHETIPQLQAAARENSHVDMLVRAVTFSDGARWHLEQPTSVANLRWTDVCAGGHTDTGAALRLVAEAMKIPPMPERAVSPTMVLVTDGYHTDDFDGGLAALMAERWGREAVRLAIAIGRDSSMAALQKFIGNDDIAPLWANNAERLVRYMRWASRSGVDRASQMIDMNPGVRMADAVPDSHSASANLSDEW